ncbi:MAG: 1,6-anhydro-N-acetylmuramyl-L-alanine amidase AmpD [Nevskia sp.]
MTLPRWASDRMHPCAVPLRVDAVTHRLQGAAYLPSPNCDQRPAPADLSLLVIHSISLPPEEFGGSGINDLFLNRLDPSAHPYFETIQALRVSAHLCIFRDGRITQYVPFDRRAWHAGVSGWQGRERCNDFSIGIELEGSDTQPFTDAQYAALGAATTALLQAYPSLRREAIAGHSDIAPGRKTDPGPCFDWPRYRAALDTSA